MSDWRTDNVHFGKALYNKLGVFYIGVGKQDTNPVLLVNPKIIRKTKLGREFLAPLFISHGIPAGGGEDDIFCKTFIHGILVSMV